MVYPSPGCQTCKRRRIKCDQAKPLCGRCRKSRYSCTWEGEGKGLPFRDENAFAQGRPRRPRHQPQTASSIVPALSFPLQLHAMNYFAENLMFGANELGEMGQEYTSHVLPLWNRAPAGSSLYLSVLALAHAAYGRGRKVPQALLHANGFYSQGIMKVKNDILSISNEDIDPLLMTIMLMGTFENIMWGLNPHNPRNPASRPDAVGSRLWANVCHHKGASGLLRLRQVRGLPTDRPLDRMVRRQLIRIVILRGRTIPPELQRSDSEAEGPMRELDALVLRMAALRAKSMHLIGTYDGKAKDPQADVEMIVQEATKLELDFENWATNASADWKFLTITPPPSPTAESTEPHRSGHAYTTHGHAVVWNRYRAVRLIVNSILMRALRVIPTQSLSTLAQQSACRKTIEALVDDLCTGVDYFFNRRNPDVRDCGASRSIKIGDKTIHTECEILPKMSMLVAWPLAVAVSTETVSEPQRKFLRTQLRFVADSLGDAVLDSIAERGEFKF